jgi:hypothetical protein
VYFICSKKFAKNISYHWLTEWYVDLLSCVRPGAQLQVTSVSVVRPVREVGRAARCVRRRWHAPYCAVTVYDADSRSHVWCEWRLVSTANQHCLNLQKPTGYAMHQQFNIQQLYALPTLYLCVLYLSENKQRLVIRVALQYFTTLSYKQHDFRKEKTVLYNFYLKHFSI